MNLNEGQAKLVLNMIDIGSARGAWRGAELNAIGQLYDYINSHIQSKNQKVVPVNAATVATEPCVEANDAIKVAPK